MSWIKPPNIPPSLAPAVSVIERQFLSRCRMLEVSTQHACSVALRDDEWRSRIASSTMDYFRKEADNETWHAFEESLEYENEPVILKAFFDLYRRTSTRYLVPLYFDPLLKISTARQTMIPAGDPFLWTRDVIRKTLDENAERVTYWVKDCCDDGNFLMCHLMGKTPPTWSAPRFASWAMDKPIIPRAPQPQWWDPLSPAETDQILSYFRVDYFMGLDGDLERAVQAAYVDAAQNPSGTLPRISMADEQAAPSLDSPAADAPVPNASQGTPPSPSTKRGTRGRPSRACYEL